MALQLNRSGKDKSATSTSGTGKSARGAPVTAHPLFPAVVALWFGALFGLGSLAMRVGLLESLVLATRIDTVIPAAAPPLGISARILLALALATLGALLGVAIARRIAAPKPVMRERKRKAVLSPDETVNLRSRDAHPDAPARRPLSINDALGDGSAADSGAGGQSAGDPLAGRRRSALAIEQDDTFELHDLAPLPGSSQQFQPLSSDPAGSQAEAPLELGDYAEANEDRLAASFEGPALDWQNATSSTAVQNPAPQVFHADGDAAAVSHHNFSPPSDAATGRQVFGMKHPQPDEVLDQLGITDAEFEPVPTADMPFDAPSSPQFGTADLSAITTVPVDAEKCAQADAADPETMLMTDLANRLAESMQRRRERTARAAEVAVATSVAPVLTEVLPESAAQPAMADQETTQSVGLDRLSEADTPGEVAKFAHPNQIPTPPLAAVPAVPETRLSFAEFPAAQPAAVAAVLPDLHRPLFGKGDLAVPAGLRPLSFEALADDDEDDELVAFLPPRNLPGVGSFHSEIDAPALAVAPNLTTAPARPFEVHVDPAPSPLAAGHDAIEGEPGADDKFSSLLNLNRSAEPRQSFVRIEANDEPMAAIEPVVIFPGQIGRIAAADPASVQPSVLAPDRLPDQFDAGAQSFRQFDSPASADAGQAVASATTVPHDPAETERALRAALANLQRMSGAA